MRARCYLFVLVVAVAASERAQANDLGDAVRWVQEQGADEQVSTYEVHAEGASDHSALALINTRQVYHGGLEAYDCDDSPVDGEFVFRTNGNQRWADRACRELRWQKESLPGYVTLGPRALPEKDIRRFAERASAQSQVPATLLVIMAKYLSGYRPGVVSERGHKGLLQLRPKVLRNLGIKHGHLLDPAENMRAGAEYFRYLVFRYRNFKLALAAFQDGPHVVEVAGRKLPRHRRYLWFVREINRIYNATLRAFPDEIGAESLHFVWTWMD